MATETLVRSHGDLLCPDGARTVLRPFHIVDPTSTEPNEREARIVDRIIALGDEELEAELRATVGDLKRRHDHVDAALDARFADLVKRYDGKLERLDRSKARLIGAFFTEEFSVEAAALFNPSAVPHPDQSGLAEGDTRFIMSLRGIGEGHISSLLFQSGVWHADGGFTLEDRGQRLIGPQTNLPSSDGGKRTAELCFPDVAVGERVIYPFLPSQGRGIEDARFCRFVEDDGTADYRCTFTAFDGMQTRQAVFRTDDFVNFVGRRLDGDLAFHKGAAWFPRRVDGRYAMLGRVDEESVSVFFSDDPDCWSGNGATVLSPRFSWEFVQMGNCGSPIEIDEGWLVLTHGVGRARRYCMGAALLDRDDPTRLLARTFDPILEPNEEEQGGYVPNVVYSCGGFARGRTLLLPYGIADNFAAIGTVDLDALVAAMS